MKDNASDVVDLVDAAHEAWRVDDLVNARALLGEAKSTYENAIEAIRPKDRFRIEADIERIEAVLLYENGDSTSREHACRRLESLCHRWANVAPTTVQERFLVARASAARAFAFSGLGDTNRLRSAIVAYDEAIAMLRTIEANGSTYRDELTRILSNKAHAQAQLEWVKDLAASISTFDIAIFRCRDLDLTVSKNQALLAATLSGKSAVLLNLGGIDNVRAALAMLDEAIVLQRSLAINIPRYREQLANSLSTKGVALHAQRSAEDIVAAIKTYNEAIALSRELDLGVAGHRATLATYLDRKAMAIADLGGPENIDDAIEAYDEAIALRRTLDLQLPEHRNDLAGAISNKGGALLHKSLHDVENLKAAIAAFDEALYLRGVLDLRVPTYCNHQAVGFAGKASALRRLGGVENLAAAITAYDEAIALRRSLDLGIPEYCNNLAVVLLNNANLLLDQRGATNLDVAVPLLDESIQLLRSLDLKMPAHRHDLALVLSAKGRALYTFGGLEKLGDAIALLKQSLDLLAPAVLDGLDFSAEAARTNGSVSFWCIRALSAARRYDEATDIGDEALRIERHLEELGWTERQSARFGLFDATLAAYRMAGLSHFMPEVIREELDPHRPGSVWDSAEMHGIAMEHLDAAIAEVRHRGPETLQKMGLLIVARGEFETLAARCFAGTVESARLRAEAAEKRHDLAKARQIIDRYVSVRPSDPQGYLLRATFRQRNKDTVLAQEDFHEAMRRIVLGAPRPTLEARTALGDIAEALMLIALDDTLGRSTEHSSPDDILAAALEPLNYQFLRQRDFLIEEAAGPFRREWAEALFATVVERPLTIARQLRANILAASTSAKRRDTIATERQRGATRGKEAITSAGSLARPWGDFVERLLAARSELNDNSPASIDSAEIEALGNRATQTAMDTLSHDALARGEALLAEILAADELTALDAKERRYLAIALMCARDPILASFTVLQVGCALEHALLQRLFLPLRLRWKAQKQAPPEPKRADAARLSKLYDYLNYERSIVELGPLVTGAVKAMFRIDRDSGETLVSALSRYLKTRPGSWLLQVPEDRRRARTVRLWLLIEERNRASHANLVGGGGPGNEQLSPQETAKRVLDAALGTPDIAFFRYFPGVFVARHHSQPSVGTKAG